MSQSRHDQTERNVFYKGHPPYCTCYKCQINRLRHINIKRMSKSRIFGIVFIAIPVLFGMFILVSFSTEIFVPIRLIAFRDGALLGTVGIVSFIIGLILLVGP
jgi:hypothetical protein